MESVELIGYISARGMHSQPSCRALVKGQYGQFIGLIAGVSDGDSSGVQVSVAPHTLQITVTVAELQVEVGRQGQGHVARRALTWVHVRPRFGAPIRTLI